MNRRCRDARIFCSSTRFPQEILLLSLGMSGGDSRIGSRYKQQGSHHCSFSFPGWLNHDHCWSSSRSHSPLIPIFIVRSPCAMPLFGAFVRCTWFSNDKLIAMSKLYEPYLIGWIATARLYEMGCIDEFHCLDCIDWTARLDCIDWTASIGLHRLGTAPDRFICLFVWFIHRTALSWGNAGVILHRGPTPKLYLEVWLAWHLTSVPLALSPSPSNDIFLIGTLPLNDLRLNDTPGLLS